TAARCDGPAVDPGWRARHLARPPEPANHWHIHPAAECGTLRGWRAAPGAFPARSPRVLPGVFRMLRTLILSSAIALALSACGDRGASESTMPATDTAADAQSGNALFTASTLPFQAPQFDKLKDGDYQPAIEEGMRQHLA